MPRPIWKGQISFGLVTIPVQLYSAEARSEEVRFHLLDKSNLARVRNQRINEETGKPVEWEDIVKGYELEDGSMITFTDEELDEFELEANQEIEISDFVDASAIPYAYFEKPYYLIPEKRGRKGYILLREAMKKSKRVGISKVIIRTKESLAALALEGDALMLYLLRYSNELRKPEAESIPKGTLKDFGVTPKEVEIAQQLIGAMSSEWNPEQYRDEYRDSLKSLIELRAKKGGKKRPATKEEVKPAGEVIDIMELLKASMAREKPNPKIKQKSA